MRILYLTILDILEWYGEWIVYMHTTGTFYNEHETEQSQMNKYLGSVHVLLMED